MFKDVFKGLTRAQPEETPQSEIKMASRTTDEKEETQLERQQKMEECSPHPIDPNRSVMIDKLSLALLKTQAEMDPARKTKDNPFFKSKYADLTMIYQVSRGVSSKNGLVITQTTRVCNNTNILVTTLIHTSGQWLKSEITLPTINKPVDMGAVLTYYRRYAIVSILGISVDDDTDGNASNGKPYDDRKVDAPVKSAKMPTLTKNAVLHLTKEFKKCEPEYEHQLLKHFGLTDWSNLPAAKLDKVLGAIKKHLEKMNLSAISDPDDELDF